MGRDVAGKGVVAGNEGAGKGESGAIAAEAEAVGGQDFVEGGQRTLGKAPGHEAVGANAESTDKGNHEAESGTRFAAGQG